jgi:hypothetical protein
MVGFFGACKRRWHGESILCRRPNTSLFSFSTAAAAAAAKEGAAPMDRIAAAAVYEILVRAGAEQTAAALGARSPESATLRIPPCAKLNGSHEKTGDDEDTLLIEAMVRYAAGFKRKAAPEAAPAAPAAAPAAAPVDVPLPPPPAVITPPAAGDLVVRPWTPAELEALRRAVAEVPIIADRNARFRAVAALLADAQEEEGGSSAAAAALPPRSKRECYEKAAELGLLESAGSAQEAAAVLVAPAGVTPAPAPQPPHPPAASFSSTAAEQSMWEEAETTAAKATATTTTTSASVVSAHGSFAAAPAQAPPAGSEDGIEEVVLLSSSSQSAPRPRPTAAAAAAASGWEDAAAAPPPSAGTTAASSFSSTFRAGDGVGTEEAGTFQRSAARPIVVPENISARPPAASSASSAAAAADDLVLVDEEDFDTGTPRRPPAPSAVARAAPPTPLAAAALAAATAAAPSATAPLSAADRARRAQSLYQGPAPRGTPGTPEQVARLRMALHGQLKAGASGTGDAAVTPVPALRAEWLTQGLAFSDEEGLRYGLLQHKGGPCGALACVNAEAVRHLFYAPSSAFSEPTAAEAIGRSGAAPVPLGAPSILPYDDTRDGGVAALDPEPQTRARALVLAITDIVWRCRPAAAASPAIVAVFDETLPRAAPQTLRVDGSLVSVSADGITERLRLFPCPTPSDVAAVVEGHMDVFMRSVGPGLAMVVYSALLTRGVGGGGGGDTVAADADPSVASLGASLGGMVGGYGYASQELVNLLLTGRATSNTIDGQRVFEDGGEGAGAAADRVTLAGVSARPSCGFLSVLAAAGHEEVGKNYKEPWAPCWVVFGESHYSVLFAAPRPCAWPAGAAKPRPTYGRAQTGPSFPADPSRCLGLGALASAAGGRPLDVVYWDGLARQDELYRLTVLPPGGAGGSPYAGPETARDVDLSAIELWAWCGWGPGTTVAWNGSEKWEPLRISADHLPKMRRGRG